MADLRIPQPTDTCFTFVASPVRIGDMFFYQAIIERYAALGCGYDGDQ